MTTVHFWEVPHPAQNLKMLLSASKEFNILSALHIFDYPATTRGDGLNCRRNGTMSQGLKVQQYYSRMRTDGILHWLYKQHWSTCATGNITFLHDTLLVVCPDWLVLTFLTFKILGPALKFHTRQVIFILWVQVYFLFCQALNFLLRKCLFFYSEKFLFFLNVAKHPPLLHDLWTSALV